MNIALLIIGGILLVAMAVCIFLNKDYLKYSKFFRPIVDAICTAISAVSQILPDNETIKTIMTIVKAAIIATQKAEECWINGTIDKTQRNMYAKEYISEVLEAAGITLSETYETIIDGVIAIVCALMPHGREEQSNE